MSQAKRPKRKPDRRIQCPQPGCNFKCFRYFQLHSHRDQKHLCRDCAQDFLDISKHRNCPHLGERRAEYQPDPLDLGIFNEIVS